MALPCFCGPEKLVGQEVLILTDEAIVCGWDSRKVTTTIRSIQVIAAFLGCWVQLLPRVSTSAARLAAD